MAAINVCRINGRTLRTSLVRHVTYSFLHGLVQGIRFLSFFSIYTFFWSLIVEQKVIWPIWGLWHPNSTEMRLPGSTSLPLQAPSLSLPCHIWLLPIRLTMVAGVTRFPQLSLPSSLLSRCLTSPCGGMHLLLLLFSSNWEGKKKITHQRSATSQGRVGFSTTYPLSDLSFALLVFQGKEKKKRAPKLWSLGRWSGSWSSPLNFFIDSKVHASTCIQSRGSWQNKAAEKNSWPESLKLPMYRCSCFSSWWQSLVIDNVLPKGLNPFSPKWTRVKSHGLENNSYPSVCSKEMQHKWMAIVLRTNVKKQRTEHFQTEVLKDYT